MKTCPVCKQNYTDQDLYFCLNDGTALVSVNDEPQPTVFMNPDRQTGQIRTDLNTNPGWDNQPLINQVDFGMNQPVSFQEPNQTLPIISLILGILSVVLGCCWGGIPLGTGAAITGFLAIQNINREPMNYTGRGMAVGGIVTGAIGLILGLLMIILAYFPIK